MSFAVAERLEAMGLLGLATRVARERGVTLADLLGRRRTPRVAAARHELYSLLYGLGYSSTEIGRAVDRDHATVLHGISVRERRLAESAARVRGRSA